MSQEFKNNVLTKALEKWLVTMPRWGYTQADELNELLENHSKLVPHTQLPQAVLSHPVQLQVLLEEGFALDSLAVGVDLEGNVIRRLACLLDAPPWKPMGCSPAKAWQKSLRRSFRPMGSNGPGPWLPSRSTTPPACSRKTLSGCRARRPP